MKKILIVLFTLLMLTACQKSSLEKVGYSVSDISLIKKLSPAHQAMFENTINEDLLTLLHQEDFSEDKIDLYEFLKQYFEGDLLMELVNSEMLKGVNVDSLKGILDDKYFIYESLEDYLNMAKNDPGLSSREVVERVNTLRNKTFYQDIQPTDTSKDTLMIVNKYYYLDEDYVPEDLESIPMKYCQRSVQMARKEVKEKFIKMCDDAAKENITLYVNSGYRSYSLQSATYNSFLNTDSQAKVDTYSARPGFSEHQTGLALDILSPGYDFDNFQDSEAYTWLTNNAYKYGFIERYPLEKQSITGYKYEPWHYRYVGEKVAKEFKDLGITYDEYYTFNLK